MRSAISFAIAGLLCGSTTLAQFDCTDYYRFNCERATDTRFSLNGQSKSASVQVGVPTELNLIVYRGQDYRISFCYDEKVLGENLTARLIEKVREPREETVEETVREPVLDENGRATGRTQDVKRMVKRTTFSDVRKVLWDNTEHEMATAVEFSCTATKRLVVEVIAAGATAPKGKYKDLDIGCVGILVEHMASPPMGF